MHFISILQNLFCFFHSLLSICTLYIPLLFIFPFNVSVIMNWRSMKPDIIPSGLDLLDTVAFKSMLKSLTLFWKLFSMYLAANSFFVVMKTENSIFLLYKHKADRTVISLQTEDSTQYCTNCANIPGFRSLYRETWRLVNDSIKWQPPSTVTYIKLFFFQSSIQLLQEIIDKIIACVVW